MLCGSLFFNHFISIAFWQVFTNKKSVLLVYIDCGGISKLLHTVKIRACNAFTYSSGHVCLTKACVYSSMCHSLIVLRCKPLMTTHLQWISLQKHESMVPNLVWTILVRVRRGSLCLQGDLCSGLTPHSWSSLFCNSSVSDLPEVYLASGRLPFHRKLNQGNLVSVQRWSI